MKKQNVVLKVGIGLVLGMGALTFAPRSAQAATPCTPDIPTDTATCVTPPQSLCTHTVNSATTNCKDTDGDCTRDSYFTGTTEVYTCKVYPNGLDKPYTLWGPCAQTLYTYGGPCS